MYVHISGSVDCIGNEAIPNKTSQSLLVFFLKGTQFSVGPSVVWGIKWVAIKFEEILLCVWLGTTIDPVISSNSLIQSLSSIAGATPLLCFHLVNLPVLILCWNFMFDVENGQFGPVFTLHFHLVTPGWFSPEVSDFVSRFLVKNRKSW